MSSRQPGAELAWLLQCLPWGGRASRYGVMVVGPALGKVLLQDFDIKLHVCTPPAGCKLVSKANKHIQNSWHQKISCQKLRRSNSVHLQHENRPMGWHVAMCIYSALSREPLKKSNVWQESAPIPKYGCAAHFHLSSSRSTPVIVFLMASPSHRLQDWVARVCSD